MSDPSRWGACSLPQSNSEVASSVAQQGHSEGTQGPRGTAEGLPSMAEQRYAGGSLIGLISWIAVWLS